ncbi:MAG: molybdopterin molybdotransferase MoeA [Stellaceae bacterium]
MAGDGVKTFTDVRMRGFADRVPVADALRWIDEQGHRLAAEEIALADAAGRVLALPVRAPADLPPADCAALDGFAVRAADTLGAGDYDPAVLRLADPAGPLPPGNAAMLVAGAALPAGAEAVAPFEWAQVKGISVEIFAPVAEGSGILRRGQDIRAGDTALADSRRLQPADLALLAALGIGRISVVRRPLVRLVIAGAKNAAPDADGPMLQNLIARDGGLIERFVAGLADRTAMAAAIAAPSADAVLIAGRSGTGADDIAPRSLADSGTVAIHGIALKPGGSTGMGSVQETSVILLPGALLACFAAYELFAGRLIRALGGRRADFPHPVREIELAGKLVSTIGLVEFRPVRISGGSKPAAEPLAVSEGGGLAALREADGFALVPAALEGWAPGTPIRVYLCGNEAETP